MPSGLTSVPMSMLYERAIAIFRACTIQQWAQMRMMCGKEQQRFKSCRAAQQGGLRDPAVVWISSAHAARRINDTHIWEVARAKHATCTKSVRSCSMHMGAKAASSRCHEPRCCSLHLLRNSIPACPWGTFTKPPCSHGSCSCEKLPCEQDGPSE